MKQSTSGLALTLTCPHRPRLREFGSLKSTFPLPTSFPGQASILCTWNWPETSSWGRSGLEIKTNLDPSFNAETWLWNFNIYKYKIWDQLSLLLSEYRYLMGLLRNNLKSEKHNFVESVTQSICSLSSDGGAPHDRWGEGGFWN